MKILQYNIFGVPFASLDINERHRNICVELKKIINNENPDIHDVDVIILCEVFTSYSRDVFTQFFNKMGWNSNRSPSSKSIYLSGGLLVASKKDYKFKHARHTTYTSCSFVDCFAYKGFLNVLLNYRGRDIRVIATHMQDETWDKDGSVRKKQFKAIIDSLDEETEQPTIIIGDFNIRIHSRVFQYVMKKLNKQDKWSYTAPKVNTHPDGVLDYAFYCNADVTDCTVHVLSKNGKPLSDHKAVLTTLQLRPSSYEKEKKKSFFL